MVWRFLSLKFWGIKNNVSATGKMLNCRTVRYLQRAGVESHGNQKKVLKSFKTPKYLSAKVLPNIYTIISFKNA